MTLDTKSPAIDNTLKLGPRPGRSEDSAPRTNGEPRDFGADPERPRRPLTEREKQILRLVCDGLTNAEIALRLGISPETVKSELKRIFHKIEVKNRTQAAVVIVTQGLV